MIHFIYLVGLSYFYFSNHFRIVYIYYTAHSCDVTSEYICFLPSSIYAIMATHSSVLAWRIPGPGEPGGLPTMGSHRVGHD